MYYYHCYESHKTPKLINHSMYAESLKQTHANSMIAASVSVNPYENYLVDLSFMFLSCLQFSLSYNPFNPSFAGFPKLHLKFVCGFLHCSHHLAEEASLVTIDRHRFISIAD